MMHDYFHQIFVSEGILIGLCKILCRNCSLAS